LSAPAELIGARWSESLTWSAARWDIPAERMKMRTPHTVPLCPASHVDVLRTLQTVTGERELLFPGERDPDRAPMCNNTILMALERMGYKGTG
jgi:integrase